MKGDTWQISVNQSYIPAPAAAFRFSLPQRYAAYGYLSLINTSAGVSSFTYTVAPNQQII